MVHPINLALNAKYRDTPIYCLSENFKEGIRCDITWKYRNGENLDIIAVLELKRRGVLRWDDFECAESDATTRDDRIREAYDNMSDDGVATTLKRQCDHTLTTGSRLCDTARDPVYRPL